MQGTGHRLEFTCWSVIVNYGQAGCTFVYEGLSPNGFKTIVKGSMFRRKSWSSWMWPQSALPVDLSTVLGTAQPPLNVEAWKRELQGQAITISNSFIKELLVIIIT